MSFLLDFFNDRLVHLEETENQLPVDIIARVPVIGEEDFTNAAEYPDSRSRYLAFAKDHPEFSVHGLPFERKACDGGFGRTQWRQGYYDHLADAGRGQDPDLFEPGNIVGNAR